MPFPAHSLAPLAARSLAASSLADWSLAAWPLPADASAHGPALDAHLRLNLTLALALFVLAHLLIFAGLLFRRRQTEPAHDRRHKLLLEHLPLAALTLLFAWLGLRAHRLWAAQRYTGAAPESLQVEATGMQFAWYFRYPGRDRRFGLTRPDLLDPGAANPLGLDPADRFSHDDIVTPTLVLPAGRQVDLTLRAQDVIHGFFLPELRLKQNAVPGLTTHVHFTPTTPGDYAILCSQVCGLGHFRMQARLRVLPAPDFDRWLEAQESAAQNNAAITTANTPGAHP